MEASARVRGLRHARGRVICQHDVDPLAAGLGNGLSPLGPSEGDDEERDRSKPEQGQQRLKTDAPGAA